MPPKGKKSNKSKNGKSKKSTTKVPLAIKSYISKTIKGQEETKFVSLQYSYSLFNGTINSPADIITLMPAIGQGTSNDARIGNQIRPIRMEINGYILYNTANTGGNVDARMLGARLFVYQDRSNRAVENSVQNYNLLTLGGNSINYTGTAMNWITPHNKDQFTFYADKRFKVLKPYGVTNSIPQGTVASMQDMDSSLYNSFKIILGPKQLPAVLRYDQTDNNSYPTNFNPKIALGYSDLLNATPDTTTTQLAMTFCCTLYYKDA